jgi:hypothetical protein
MVAASKTEETDQITSPCTALISFVPVNTENIKKTNFIKQNDTPTSKMIPESLRKMFVGELTVRIVHMTMNLKF